MATKCIKFTAKGIRCSKNAKVGDLCTTHSKVPKPKHYIDNYTKEVLNRRFMSHTRYVSETLKIIEETGLPIRCPNMPEDISENIVKFVIQNYVGDTTSKWAKCMGKKTGDLISDIENVQEVKCFTSDGPNSYGPTAKHNILYFLDAREWLSDKLVVWRVALSNTSPEWKRVKMNKKKGETHEDQSGQGRRPRIPWHELYPQVKDYCTKVFEGKFEDVFNPPAKA